MARSNRGTTSGQHSFARIPSADIQRSSFNRSCGLKTTFNGGELVPIFVDEALPGDTISLRMSLFARMATPLHPIMDNLYLDYQFFAVPMRLLWDNWQNFNGEQKGTDFEPNDYEIPTIDYSGINVAALSLHDYLGIPTEVIPTGVSAMWHRAYVRIWNEWYRDQNQQTPATMRTDDGPDGHGQYTDLKSRGKRHDYFTSCLPWPQKGDAVTLPVGDTAPVTLNSGTVDVFGTGTSTAGLGIPQFLTQNDTVVELTGTIGNAPVDYTANWGGTTGVPLEWDPFETALKANLTGFQGVADLSGATAITINQLREAVQIQRLYERDARGGTRYTEILRSHFGVTSPDQRLQRPEYLGGGSTAININPIPQTSATEVDSEQGNLAAFATASSNGSGFVQSFTEHCVILGLCSVRADLNYQQGLPRMFSRSTRWDFYWPSLAHLGEQAVLNKEIFAQGTAGGTDDDDVFGYQERHAEYRYKASQITGLFRSNHAQSLDTWHLAQDFASLPSLGAAFIEDNPPIDRVIAVPSEPHFLLDAFFHFKHARPMPTYGVPGQMDRF